MILVILAGLYLYMGHLFNSVDSAQIKSLGAIRIGSTVRHTTFGIGSIKAIHENKGSYSVNILFDSQGSTWLIPEKTSLELIESPSDS